MGVFKFKQFGVEQGQTAMKVGTDGCLLGAWASYAAPERILDIGTGTGVVALMLAQRYPQAIIDAVELEEAAANQAKANFEASPWEDRLSLYRGGIQEFESELSYDLIVSNPPFYPEADFSLAKGEARQLARSTVKLPYAELLSAAKRLLSPKGLFQLVLPANLADNFSQLANKFDLKLAEMCWIQPLPHREANRVLLSYSFEKIEIVESQVVIRLSTAQRHHYSAEYTELLKDFLIIF
jgi:tRNA1Val (adenine37-N6)-methyltransferase